MNQSPPTRHVPPQWIGADAVEDIVRIDDVAQRLRHLLAVFVDDVCEANAVLISNAVRDQGSNGM